MHSVLSCVSWANVVPAGSVNAIPLKSFAVPLSVRSETLPFRPLVSACVDRCNGARKDRLAVRERRCPSVLSPSRRGGHVSHVRPPIVKGAIAGVERRTKGGGLPHRGSASREAAIATSCIDRRGCVGPPTCPRPSLRGSTPDRARLENRRICGAMCPSRTGGSVFVMEQEISAIRTLRPSQPMHLCA